MASGLNFITIVKAAPGKLLLGGVAQVTSTKFKSANEAMAYGKASAFVAKKIKAHLAKGDPKKQAIAIALEEARRKGYNVAAKNPAERKQIGRPPSWDRPILRSIGRKCTVIETTSGRVAGNFGGVFGLKDGSVFIAGFFKQVPSGNVLAVEYLDEGKAKRENLENPGQPWVHDFSKEAVSLRRCKGGLLLKAKKHPLWGMI